jgi:AbiV family abortive infection protein
MKVTREELIALCKKSLANAEALIQEAELLHQNERWARAVFLCHTAGEEFGKCIECLSAAMDHARGVLNWNRFWKRFFSHREKTKVIDFFESFILTEGDLTEDLKELNEKANILTQGRSATLYSGVFSDGTVFAPAELFTEQIATNALKWAKGRLRLSKAMIVPILDSKAVSASDEEIRKGYDEFVALLRDPKKREEFMARLERVGPPAQPEE